MFTLPLPAAANIGEGGGSDPVGDDEGVRVTLPGQIVLGESGAFIMGREGGGRGQATSAKNYTLRLNVAKPITTPVVGKEVIKLRVSVQTIMKLEGNVLFEPAAPMFHMLIF